jgi:hypothetical protein
VTVKILYTKIRNKRYLNANKIIEIQKTLNMVSGEAARVQLFWPQHTIAGRTRGTRSSAFLPLTSRQRSTPSQRSSSCPSWQSWASQGTP